MLYDQIEPLEEKKPASNTRLVNNKLQLFFNYVQYSGYFDDISWRNKNSVQDFGWMKPLNLPNIKGKYILFQTHWMTFLVSLFLGILSCGMTLKRLIKTSENTCVIMKVAKSFSRHRRLNEPVVVC